MLLGLSTGILRESLSIGKIIEFYKELGCKAVEISPSHIFNIESPLEEFEYVSTHDATEFNYADDNKTHGKLRRLEEKCKFLNVSLVVIHPTHVDNWKVLKEYNIPWAVENMDNRNSVGVSVKQIRKIVDDTGFNVVLDLNHCFTHDPTMSLADEFLKEFKEKVKELHIGGYRDSSAEGRHTPLSTTHQLKILDSVRDLPTIIEIDYGTKESIRKEFLYVKDQISSRGVDF